jgi:hypothetical protein
MTTSEDLFSAASAQASTVAGCRSLAGDSAIDMLPDDVLLYIFNTYRWAFRKASVMMADVNGPGTSLYTYAEDGDTSSSHSPAISICTLYAIPKQTCRGR